MESFEQYSALDDMSSEDFRSAGHLLIEWMSTYMDEMESLPVLPRVKPGETSARCSNTLTAEGESYQDIFEDFESSILPGITHWNHPGFFAYFADGGSVPGLLGEMLSAALNVNAMLWKTSPAATELEESTLGILRSLVGLPDEFFGVINDTASSSSLYALAAARNQSFPDVGHSGMFGMPKGRIYTSEQSHSSIDKAGITLGFGTDGISKVKADSEYRMDPAELRRLIEEDLKSGVVPVAIVATIGTTSTSSIDPVDEISKIAKEYDIWLHVDAAYGGPAAILHELRPYFSGWELADSIVMNPHKWLFTPVDCSVLYCQNPGQLRRAFSIVPEYLQGGSDEVTNLMDYGVSLGRRFRSLKLWFVLRYFGEQGLAKGIRSHCKMASNFASWIEEHPEWELVAPAPFSTVVFRYAGISLTADQQDEANLSILEEVNEAGEIFISHTRLDGKFVLRLSIGNIQTKERHVQNAWKILQESSSEWTFAR
ncbi:MAG: amino acid decarboxylase [Gemmatimonadetes bacterium]|nr:amino acid decarboxylase [Gemmatimonadota bacterium]MCH2452087.1 pyridoxal-dependent decarboxylase [Gemmatimonadota bacterium]|tara:strand:+ start:5454 stop:6908 length:1455 start_codon:yes stop_codon:yes gene_type:complete